MKTLGNSAVSLLVGIAFLIGCASIVSKSKYPVRITSDPPGVDIVITNSAGAQVFSGTTPTTVVLSASAGFFRGETYTVTFSRQGYMAQTATLQSRLDGWYIGNLFFGGLLGLLIIDPATGAMWALPESLHVELTGDWSSLPGAKLHIVTIDQVPEHLRAKLIRIN